MRYWQPHRNCLRQFGEDTIAPQLISQTVIEYNLAQSAADTRKTHFHIDAFWEKPTVTPSLLWDKWSQQWKLAMLAKEGSQWETLQFGPPPAATYPPEQVYEDPMENQTKATEKNRKICEQHANVNWQN